MLLWHNKGMKKTNETHSKDKRKKPASHKQSAGKAPAKRAGKPSGKKAAPKQHAPKQAPKKPRLGSLCPVSHECGACQSIDRPYAEQLAEKQRYMEDLFEGLAPKEVMRSVLGMESPFHYRNKVISPYAPGRKLPGNRREILTGMYAKGTHKLVPTDTCLLENEIAKKVTLAVRSIMARYDVEPYNEDTGEGFIRHAVVRVGHNSGEVLVTLVTNADEFPSSKSFCRELVKRVPQITTVVQNINTRQTNVILGEKERTLYGPGFILDTLCELSFRISSHSFYQVNATQTEVLYSEAITMAQLDGRQTAIDAYCGTGTIGLVAAKRGAARVIGVDSVSQAIADARLNAKHNGIENAEFVAADAGEFMRGLAASGTPDDLVLFMDPPRAGSSEEFLDAAAIMSPERIVYISCNPETQVRDVRYLRRHGYEVAAVQPVDMFPHTEHVESIVLLVKAKEPAHD